MASGILPPISELSTLGTTERAAVLDLLFEPCVPLHTLSIELLGSKTFNSYDDMITSVGLQLTDLAESELQSDTEWLEEILRAHPRLGEKKVESTQSRAEQAQLSSGGTGQESELVDLNSEYEHTFPGLRYVVFVNGRSRPVIMNDMRERINHADIGLERIDAIRAMCEIAADRARKNNSIP